MCMCFVKSGGACLKSKLACGVAQAERMAGEIEEVMGGRDSTLQAALGKCQWN